ncbi:MAG: nucleotide sugar dehydrogenase [Actinobacteria bacterium]|nr:nucleotide sugar dehydrogenase [Actinomycetota bacterium]
MDVCMVALGKIGLPLAVQIASKGHRVRGVDIDERVVDLVNSGHEPFPGEADLDVRLKDVVERGLLTATTDGAGAVAASEIVVVVVPLIVDAVGRPDFGALDAATQTVAAGLRPGTLVSYETTLPVHTTRRRFGPMLERGSGLTVGQDLFLCHSPERVFSGRVFSDLRRYPKLVGGTDPESARRAVAFYEAVLDLDERPDLDRPNGVWDLGSAEAAELAKLVETTYRDVNIALANEFAVFADRIGVDVYDVIAASNSQPFSHVHQPGVAVGGHCIPVYPRFYLSTHEDAVIPRAARTVNEGMPRYAVELLSNATGSLSGARVAVLGAAYRGGVKETAFSGVFPLVAELRNAGATALVHDPLYGDDELTELGFAPYRFGEPVDAAIVQADHREYASIGPGELPGIRVLVDGRACTDPARWEQVPRLVIGAGRS